MQSCSNCSKALKEPKDCAKCRGASYCSKECQKADWKVHKKVCASLAASRASGVQHLDKAIDMPFHKLDQKTWLHDRSETDVYKLLVDSFLLMKSDEYRKRGATEIVDEDPEVTDGLLPFIDYVKNAEDKGLLPKWWKVANKKRCCKYGLNKNNRSRFAIWLEEKEVEERYGGLMALQLIVFANQVTGDHIWDGVDAVTREMMEAESNGDGANF